MTSLYGGYDLAALRDANTWRQLAPDLHVADTAFWQANKTPLDLPAAALDDLYDLTVHEGYFQMDPVDWQLPVFDMAGVIHALRHAGIPPVFAFVYDEYWLMHVKLAPVLARILGDGYVMLPNMWAWHVDPAAGDSGWLPHRDLGHVSLYADGRPKAINIWLPLTDATPVNGCMYVIPADRDPTYNTGNEAQMLYQLHDIRALPATAGSVLLWTQAVLHWGARSAPRRTMPRISLGIEFQRGDEPEFNSPCLSPVEMPSYEARFALIARQIKRYRHHHPEDKGLGALADML